MWPLSEWAAQTTYLQGVGYLGLYNLAFVLPLLLILIGVGNRQVMHRIRLATRVDMVLVGVVILVGSV